jgi:hypothetical protein
MVVMVMVGLHVRGRYPLGGQRGAEGVRRGHAGRNH